MTVHPIEVESYRRLADRIDLSRWPAGTREVVARIVHATADLLLADTVIAPPDVVAAAVAALAGGAPVVADVAMTAAGITGVEVECHLGSAVAGDGVTRSAAAMRLAAAAHPEGAVVVVGCAPTALDEVLVLARAGRFRPAVVLGFPVGFVGAAEAKQALRDSGLPALSNVGERGGSAVAAAACNALVRMARA